MYKRSVKKEILLGLTTHFLLAAGLFPIESRVDLGRDDGFRTLAVVRNLDIAPGPDGSGDLVLQDRQKTSTQGLDLYLSFDENPIRDASLNFSVRNENDGVLVSGNHKIRGKGSGAFQYGSRLLLTPEGKTLFSTGMVSEDFSIEFWMYPATLDEGEVIFRWENNAAEKGIPEYQEMSCVVSGRTLVWTFTDFFRAPGIREKTLKLRGVVPLVPRTWRHHALRFDSSTGMVEYLVDGLPEAVTHATGSGREDGTVAYPRIAGEGKTPFIIGEGFTGFFDEFCISRNFIEEPDLAPFSADGGYAETSVIDLGYGGSVIKRIEARYQTPRDSAVFFYYKLGNSPEEMFQAEWEPFVSGPPFKSPVRGRFLLIKTELFPDGNRSVSPRLADMSVVYEKNEPPLPPSFVAAVPGDGKVELRWSAVPDPEVRGYLVYYGSRPGVYDGYESALGPSPIRLGKETHISVEGLANGKLYYFSVSSYDEFSEYVNGQFSNETSARPSRLYRNES
jgi:hypothetical protein